MIVQSAQKRTFKIAPVSDEIPDGISSAIFFPGISFIFRVYPANASTFLEARLKNGIHYYIICIVLPNGFQYRTSMTKRISAAFALVSSPSSRSPINTVCTSAPSKSNSKVSAKPSAPLFPVPQTIEIFCCMGTAFDFIKKASECGPLHQSEDGTLKCSVVFISYCFISAVCRCFAFSSPQAYG